MMTAVFATRLALGFASGVFVVGLFHAAGESHAASVSHEVMLVNAETGKCLTIAGGRSTENNVDAVQFECDSDSSRRWMMHEISGVVFEIKNVRTGKCLTIAGGTSTANNVTVLQFDCDRHASRTWMVRDATDSGHHKIQNVQTNRCLTIAGGSSTEDNVTAVQFECDDDRSRRWIIRLVRVGSR